MQGFALKLVLVTTCKLPRISGVHEELRCSSELFLCFLSLSNKSCCQMWTPTSSITLPQESVIKSTSSCNDFFAWKPQHSKIDGDVGALPWNPVLPIPGLRLWILYKLCPQIMDGPVSRKELDKQQIGDIYLIHFFGWENVLKIFLNLGIPCPPCTWTIQGPNAPQKATRRRWSHLAGFDLANGRAFASKSRHTKFLDKIQI